MSDPERGVLDVDNDFAKAVLDLIEAAKEWRAQAKPRSTGAVNLVYAVDRLGDVVKERT